MGHWEGKYLSEEMNIPVIRKELDSKVCRKFLEGIDRVLASRKKKVRVSCRFLGSVATM